MQLTFTTPQSVDEVKFFEIINDIETVLSKKGLSCEIVSDSFQPRKHIVVHIDHADTADGRIKDDAEKHDGFRVTGKRQDEEWHLGAAQNLAQAYGPDEPEYDVSMLREVNPDYDPR